MIKKQLHRTVRALCEDESDHAVVDRGCQELEEELRKLSPEGKPISLNQIIRKEEESYLKYWKETTQNQSKMECYLALKSEYAFAEHLSTLNDPKVKVQTQ